MLDLVCKSHVCLSDCGICNMATLFDSCEEGLAGDG